MLSVLQAHLSANGAVVEIFRGREGAYEITLGILPEQPVVGTIQFLRHSPERRDL